MDKKTIVNIVGLSALALGFVSTITSEWVADKKMDEKIEKEVNEAVANAMREMS